MEFFKKIRKAIAACSGFFVLFLSITARAESTNVTVGEALQYPQGFNYMTHYFYMDGQLAYCLEPRLGPMSDGPYETTILSDEGSDGYPLLVKVLACGYGGPNDLTPIYFPGASDRDRYIYTHIAAGYAYQSNSTMTPGTYDMTGLTDEQFEACGLGDFVRAAWSTDYKGTVKIVRVNGFQDVGYLASYSRNPPPPQYHNLYITKKDFYNRVLKGAVFDVYADRECTQLIARCDETNTEGNSLLVLSLDYKEVFVREAVAPYGFVLDKTVYSYAGEQDYYHNALDMHTRGKIEIRKRDSQTGDKPQGEAEFIGAEYTIYADDTITDPSDSSVLYQKDAVVAKIVTDKNGYGAKDDLPLGKYRIKETKAPKGYLLSNEETKTEIKYDNGEKVTIEVSHTLTDDVIKGYFEIRKSKEGSPNEKIENAGFSAYFVPDIPKDKNGGFDLSKATPVKITENGGTVLYTDANGYAKSALLPYGNYLISETVVPKNYKKCEDFIVTITVNNASNSTESTNITDDYYKIKFRINKVDKESKNAIRPAENDDVLFNVFDVTRGIYTEKNLKLNKDGYVKSEKYYEAGIYRIEEIDGPDGYVLNDNYLTFNIDENSPSVIDDENEKVYEAVIENEMYLGEIKVIKTGENLAAIVKGDEKEKKSADFIYNAEPLEGALIELHAGEDIFYPDGRLDSEGKPAILYKKDELLGEEISDENGTAYFGKDKYLLVRGEYYAIEKEAPKGYGISDEKVIFSFKENPDNEKTLQKTKTLFDGRQKIVLKVRKLDKESKEVLEGAEFSLYADSDLYGSEGKVLAKKGDYICGIKTGKDGIGKFNPDLTSGKYLLKEIAAPEGYEINTDDFEVDLSYDFSEEDIIECIDVEDEKIKEPPKEQPPEKEPPKEEPPKKEPPKEEPPKEEPPKEEITEKVIQEKVQQKIETSESKGSVVKGATEKKVTKNNYKTEDNGTEGYSILLNKEDAKDNKAVFFGVLSAVFGLVIVLSVWIRYLRGKQNG